nr:hypothetical protein [Tanacetum cinerariifolium]
MAAIIPLKQTYPCVWLTGNKRTLDGLWRLGKRRQLVGLMVVHDVDGEGGGGCSMEGVGYDGEMVTRWWIGGDVLMKMVAVWCGCDGGGDGVIGDHDYRGGGGGVGAMAVVAWCLLRLPAERWQLVGLMVVRGVDGEGGGGCSVKGVGCDGEMVTGWWIGGDVLMKMVAVWCGCDGRGDGVIGDDDYRSGGGCVGAMAVVA